MHLLEGVCVVSLFGGDTFLFAEITYYLPVCKFQSFATSVESAIPRALKSKLYLL